MATGVTTVAVSPDEAGQKLTSFLRRRLGQGVPQSALMRWIRTGQVRVDGKRAKPFDRLAQGAMVRIPPHDPGAEPEAAAARPQGELPVVTRSEDLLVLAKPGGLPMHGGSKHSVSLVSLLAAAFPGADFAPTPAHRLDKDTSGLVLVALSYRRLAELNELFRARKVRKIYLAWIAGGLAPGERFTMRDELEKKGAPGKEKVRTGAGKEALAEVAVLAARSNASLVAVRLVTGRTHQIRVQLASRGHAVLGDAKYGKPAAHGLLLHCWRLVLPGEAYELAPDWPGPFAVSGLTDPFA